MTSEEKNEHLIEPTPLGNRSILVASVEDSVRFGPVEGGNLVGGRLPASFFLTGINELIRSVVKHWARNSEFSDDEISFPALQ
jgi:hypothetical protein